MVRCCEGVHNEVHRILLIIDWLCHLDGVKLLLQASLLQVGHEHGQVVSGASQRRRSVVATSLGLGLAVGDVAIVSSSLVD